MEYTNIRKHLPTSHTNRWISSAHQLLVYTPYAARRQMEIIGWLRDDFPENRNEQGGWLIGRYLQDPTGPYIHAEVTEILEAKAEIRSPGYIEWSALEEIRMQQEFFKMKEELAKTSPKEAEALRVLGWWHTHPNMPCFMSVTDKETQCLKYYKPYQFAVVLNPQEGIVRAFAGRDCTPVACVMLLENFDTDKNKLDANYKKQLDTNCKKQNRHQKRCVSKRKKRAKKRR